MFKINKNNQIIFQPGSWISKKCVILPNEKVKTKLIWLNRFKVFLYIGSILLGLALNSLLVIAGLTLTIAIFHVLYIRRLVSNFKVTDEVISFKDNVSEYSKKTSYLSLWSIVIVCLLMIIDLTRKVFMDVDDLYEIIYCIASITSFAALFGFAIYALKLKTK